MNNIVDILILLFAEFRNPLTLNQFEKKKGFWNVQNKQKLPHSWALLKAVVIRRDSFQSFLPPYCSVFLL